MMRTLAEFIMRGRWNAMAAALVGVLVPILAFLVPATVSLVVLRKGWLEGLVITVVGVTAFVVLSMFDSAPPLVLIAVGGSLVVTCCIASVLRSTVSWPAALASMVAVSTLVSLGSIQFIDNPVDSLVAGFQQWILQQNPEVQAVFQPLAGHISLPLVVGGLAVVMASHALIGLLVGRWWQAQLFNPGGFRQEMHNLRLNTPLAVLCMVGAWYCEWKGVSYAFWQMLFLLPLIVAGAGLFHCFVAWRKWGTGMLVAYYIGLNVLPPLMILTVMFGFTDVWFDYRKRFK